MLKQEFINTIQEKLDGKSKKECSEFLDAFEQTIYDTLASGDEVRIAGFGTFRTRRIAAHEGTDPRSKEKIAIPDVVTPSFVAGSALKRAVRG